MQPLMRKKLFYTFIILMMVLVPLSLSHYFYFNMDRLHLKTYQNGTFIKPMVDLDKTGFYPVLTDKLDFKEHSTWVMLTWDDHCLSYEELNHRIVTLQNIMDLMGREYKKVRAVILYPDNCSVTHRLTERLSHFSELKLIQLKLQSVNNYLPAHTVAPGSLYFIDPNGYIMMSYPENFTPQQVYPDLKKLLRVS